MKVADLFPEIRGNVKKARKIRFLARDKAKQSNPKPGEIRSGWDVDPHAGDMPNSMRQEQT